MICASAAVDPSLRSTITHSFFVSSTSFDSDFCLFRKLAYFLLSNLSRRLNYDSREKVFEELSTLFNFLM